MTKVELKGMNSPEYGAPRKVSKIHFESRDLQSYQIGNLSKSTNSNKSPEVDQRMLQQ